MLNMRLMISRSGRMERYRSTVISWPGLCCFATMTTAAKIRQTSVDRAAPAMPQRSTKIKRALPAMLMRLLTRDTVMGSLELPTERYNAALALNSPTKGYDRAVMRKYVRLASMTARSTAP